MTHTFSALIRGLGPALVAALYAILATHVYAYFKVIVGLLKKRLGVGFGMVWVAIGLSLVYNITYNHLLAVFLKPGGPRDLKRVE